MTANKFFRKPGLYPLTSEPKPKKIFGFDCETYNLNKDFLCGSIVGDNYIFYSENMDDFKHELAHNRIFANSFIAATNLQFDLAVITGGQLKEQLKQFTIIESCAKYLMAVCYVPYRPDGNIYSKAEFLKNYDIKDGYKITFIDSLSHFPASVENLAKYVGMKKMAHPECIGDRWRTEAEHQYMKEYNINDSTITYKYMAWSQEQYNKLGANLKITISSVAMDLFRRKYLGNHWLQPPRDIITDSYKSYYGGRTEAFKRGQFLAENYGLINCYDANSLYPFCMHNYEYPNVMHQYRAAKITEDMVHSLMGSGFFILDCPKDMNIPIVPTRTDKLRFTTGHIEGFYDFHSVKFALDNGYTFISGKDAIVYPHRFKPFKAMIEALYKLRKEFQAAGNPAELTTKLIMNSSYGKFGFNYLDKEELMDTFEAESEWGGRATLIPIDKNIMRVIKGTSATIPSYVFPILPQYVTAYARTYMWSKMHAIGEDRVLYTDTDSIFTTRSLPTSTDLGQFKLEKQFEKLLIIKPKLYAGYMTDGQSKIKVKGVHKQFGNYDTFVKDIQKTGTIEADTTLFTKARSSLHGKDNYINKPFTMHKSLSLDDDKRIWSKRSFTFEVQDSLPFYYKDAEGPIKKQHIRTQ